MRRATIVRPITVRLRTAPLTVERSQCRDQYFRKSVAVIHSPQICGKLIPTLCTIGSVVIMSAVCCTGCGAKNVNNCPGNASSTARCDIIINGGGSPSDPASGGDSAAGASADGSAPASGSPEGSSPAPPQGSEPAPASAPPAGKPQYSPVSLASLCSSESATQSNFGGCSDEQTAKIGQDEYAFSTYADVYDPASDSDPPLLGFASTTCRSLSLRFAIEPTDGIPSDLRITVSVQSQGARSVTIAPNQLGTLNTALSGGPFELDASANLPMGGGWTVLMDGSASCSTNSGS
jgi:hypothetical protein